jgi:hypothetical protein
MQGQPVPEPAVAVGEDSWRRLMAQGMAPDEMPTPIHAYATPKVLIVNNCRRSQP